MLCRIVMLSVLLTLTPATAQSIMQVSFKPIKGGIELDAGTGTKKFICSKDQVSYKTELGGQVVNNYGRYLTLTFNLNDNHFDIENHLQERLLAPNQIRLSCLKNEVNVKIGRYVEVVDSQ